jgi:hypothetical protein
MAKLQIFTVYDSKSEAFMPPFYARATGEALRMFENSVKTSDHDFSRWPEDYTLFQLGSFDDNTGSFEIFPTSKSLARAIQFVRKEPNLSPVPAEVNAEQLKERA